MPDPSGVSPGEIGGVTAGVIALLVAFGHGLKWLLNWNDARAHTRSAKLDIWQAELTKREWKLDEDREAYHDKVEKRLEEIDAQNQALRIAFDLVAAPLRFLDPTNPALARAEQILHAAFPLVPRIAKDMSETLGDLD